MSGPFYSYVLPFLVLFGLIALIAISLRRGPKTSRPWCGKCGYPVEGLESLRCPECGSDLRTVGIVTPRRRFGPRTIAAAVARGLLWTILMPIVAFLLSQLVWSAVSARMPWTRTTSFFWPQSGAYDGVIFQASGEAGRPEGSGEEVLNVRLLLAEGGTSRPLEFRPRTSRVMEATKNGVMSVPLSVEAVTEWMAREGINPDQQYVLTEALQICRQISANVRLPGVMTSFRSQSSSVTGSAAVRQWIAPIVVTFCGVIWVIGLASIVHGARKGIRRLGPAPEKTLAAR